MEAGRVLIVSSHPLFAEVLTRLVQEAGSEVIARVTGLEQALPLLPADTPITIIVDYEDARSRDAEWLPLLQEGRAACRLVFVTLAGNEMIVHEQRRVTHATTAELVAALRRPLALRQEEAD